MRIERKTGVELNERLESYQVQYEPPPPQKKGEGALKLLKKLASGPPRAPDLKPGPREKPQSNDPTLKKRLKKQRMSVASAGNQVIEGILLVFNWYSHNG